MSRCMHPFPRPRPFRFLAASRPIVLVGAVGLAALAGCGKSNPPERAVVPPPAPANEADNVSTSNESTEAGSTETGSSKTAPGTSTDTTNRDAGLKLPPGPVIAPPESEKPKPKSTGIEMPANADVPKNDSGASVDGKPESVSGPVTISPVQYSTWEEIEQLVTSSGQITVVDLWSLSCEPCLKEFPGLVRLHQSLGTTVRCVAFDLDYDGRKTRPPEHYEQRVTAFVDSVGARFTTYISRTPSDDVYAAAKIDSIPAVLIYDANGKIVKVYTDAGDTVGFTYDKDVIPFVAKLAG